MVLKEVSSIFFFTLVLFRSLKFESLQDSCHTWGGEDAVDSASQGQLLLGFESQQLVGGDEGRGGDLSAGLVQRIRQALSREKKKLLKSPTRVEINFCATAWSDGGILTCVLFAVVVLLACCCSWICSSCCFCIRASCSRCCWYCSAVKAERDESLLPIWKMTIHTIIDNIRLSCWDWTDSYAEKHDRGVVMRFVEKARWAIKEDQEPSVNVACKGRVWFDVALKYSADIFSSYCQDFVVSPAAASGATKVELRETQR